jgi:LysM repeat protein
MDYLIFQDKKQLAMIKRLCLILIPIILYSCSSTRQATNSTNLPVITQDRKTYITNYKDLAIREMNRCGIPASITIAQALLESDNGNSTLARKANNHFGIKCHNGWSGEKIYHDDDKRGECFRKYNYVYESYDDHSDFIVNGSRYRFLFDYGTTDYKSWAHGLQKAGYATNKNYANMLIKIIEDNQLYLYDSGLLPNTTLDQRPDTQKINLGNVDNFKIQLNRHTVYEKNRIDYIIIKKGDTFVSLTEEFQKLTWELAKYNELPQNAVLNEGQIIYLQPKRNNAEHGKNFHTVTEGETMHAISQIYGIRLKALYEKNRMTEGTEPQPGEKLYLRKTKPETATTTEPKKDEPEITEFDTE